MNSFRTIVSPKPVNINFSIKSKVLLIGSCFSENIGNKLSNSRIDTMINPHGIVFNPKSVVKSLEDYITNKNYQKFELTPRDSDFVSLNHHGSFSADNQDDLLLNINGKIALANHFLKQADLLILTLGTAWAYYHLTSNLPVANCHKLPRKDFEKRLLDGEQIVNSLQKVMDQLKKFNPKLKIILTVSPVRHWKDGVVENNLSKSHLIVAVNQLQEQNEQVTYFPAYEIMMDDLRDYRFYNSDMLHPSPLAVAYIWQKFQKTYFNLILQNKVAKIEKLNKVLTHRPKNSDAHKIQVDKTIRAIEKIIDE